MQLFPVNCTHELFLIIETLLSSLPRVEFDFRVVRDEDIIKTRPNKESSLVHL